MQTEQYENAYIKPTNSIPYSHNKLFGWFVWWGYFYMHSVVEVQ